MNIKHCTEQYLAASGLNYTIFRLCGFMQVRCAAVLLLLLVLLRLFGGLVRSCLL